MGLCMYILWDAFKLLPTFSLFDVIIRNNFWSLRQAEFYFQNHFLVILFVDQFADSCTLKNEASAQLSLTLKQQKNFRTETEKCIFYKINVFLHLLQGCQIFLDIVFQIGGKDTKLPLNYQVAQKMYQMAVIYSK
jgi:hypothetical protein